jgi:hypothetical protein
MGSFAFAQAPELCRGCIPVACDAALGAGLAHGAELFGPFPAPSVVATQEDIAPPFSSIPSICN